MGGQMSKGPSKEELVYHLVNYGNIEGIKSFRREGAGLEWMDKEGKTPLILACMRPDLLNVARVLIELGANVNACSRGFHAGTPLHHAAKIGLNQIVNLLLSNGANPLMMNDDGQTPLDLARVNRHCNVVRAIEHRVCLFSDFLRENYGPSILEAYVPRWVQRKIWAVVLPCASRNPTEPSKFELAIYSGRQANRPRVTIVLSEVHIEEPTFDQPDPSLVIVDKASETRYKFLSAHVGDKQQLLQFYHACRGIPLQNSCIPAAPPGVAPTPNPSHPTALPSAHEVLPVVSVPSAPPIVEETFYNGPAQYRTIDSSPIDLTAPPTARSKPEPPADTKATSISGAASSCVICLDAPVEGACLPCGHMAGCMSCLNEIKGKKGECPLCRAKIAQVARLYAV